MPMVMVLMLHGCADGTRYDRQVTIVEIGKVRE